MTECAIEAVALRKSFKGHEALCGLNLSVPRGSVFGFLGRNGAGKTYTSKWIAAENGTLQLKVLL
jgi:ABC-2 type transport system ATP-binding protein